MMKAIWKLRETSTPRCTEGCSYNAYKWSCSGHLVNWLHVTIRDPLEERLGGGAITYSRERERQTERGRERELETHILL